MATESKQVLILAGPNGAGKTTFAREFLPEEAACLTFINADLIAAGLAPFSPERAAVRAGRIMLQLLEEHAARGESFAFETTLAGRNYARRARVAERVRQGGHSIPEEVIRRRFAAGRLNFENVYKPIVDEWSLYDASGEAPAVIDRGGIYEFSD